MRAASVDGMRVAGHRHVVAEILERIGHVKQQVRRIAIHQRRKQQLQRRVRRRASHFPHAGAATARDARERFGWRANQQIVALHALLSRCGSSVRF